MPRLVNREEMIQKYGAHYYNRSMNQDAYWIQEMDVLFGIEVTQEFYNSCIDLGSISTRHYSELFQGTKYGGDNTDSVLICPWMLVEDLVEF